MTTENITFIGLGRIQDQAVLAAVYERINSSERAAIERTFENALLSAVSRFGPGSRQKMNFTGGTMFLVADRELCCIYAVAIRGTTYPERLAFTCLNECCEVVSSETTSGVLKTTSGGTLTKSLRKPFRVVMEKYDKPGKLDSVADVSGKVDSVKITMQDNIKKVLENQENIERLESKTESLNQQAAQYSQSAGDLRRQMYWRKVKVAVLIGLVVVGILAVIIIGIVSLFR